MPYAFDRQTSEKPTPPPPAAAVHAGEFVRCVCKNFRSSERRKLRRQEHPFDYRGREARRRAKASRPQQAKIRPGNPAPTMGAGTTPRGSSWVRSSPPGNCVVWMLKYVSPFSIPAISAVSACSIPPCMLTKAGLKNEGSSRLKDWREVGPLGHSQREAGKRWHRGGDADISAGHRLATMDVRRHIGCSQAEK